LGEDSRLADARSHVGVRGQELASAASNVALLASNFFFLFFFGTGDALIFIAQSIISVLYHNE
jgi:hypothetical protein